MEIVNETVQRVKTENKMRWFLWGVLPLVLLGAIITFILSVGTGVSNDPAAPIEVLNIEKITLNQDGFEVQVMNTGPEAVSISQVIVDGSFWNARFSPSNTLERFQMGTISIPYPWVYGDPHEIKLITSNGLLFAGEVAAATDTPTANPNLFLQYALIGFYVGVIPVGLGLMWYPFLRRFSTRGMHAILAFTVGLLLFLVVDTLEEGLEIAGTVPGAFQGTGLVWFGALLSCLLLIAIDQSNDRKMSANSLEGKSVSYKIATGIGLHNFGEGLAIGSAFAIGEAALGTFLIIGFTLHNITEGVGIAAPLLKERPSWKTFLALAALAGGPAILGTWVGGFIFNTTFAALFFGIGAGAIAQVIYVISKMIVKESRNKSLIPVSWLNFGGVALGIFIMYATALLTNF